MINKIEKLLQEARTHVAVEVNNTLPRTYKEIGKLLVEDIDSVSYTHLDVYKRQNWIRVIRQCMYRI